MKISVDVSMLALYHAALCVSPSLCPSHPSPCAGTLWGWGRASLA